jgi:Tn3 transposase DDE domain
VVELARYGLTGKAPALRRHPYARRLATLLSTVVVLQSRATDDAVELFDVLMTTELLARAQRQTRDEQARRYPRVSKDAGKLAAAVGGHARGHDLGSGDHAGACLGRDRDGGLARRAAHRGREHHRRRPGTGHRSRRGVAGHPGRPVRGGAPVPADAVYRDRIRRHRRGHPVLDALRALPDLLDARPSGRVPAGYLDARKVAVDLVPPAWTRVVFTPGRPEATVHRAGYVFCVLELFHQRLRRRDIFALASGRWADPRAQLLAGSAWEVARGPVLNALQLPTDPDALLAEHARDLDAALRHVAGRLIADTEVSIDDHGRLHAGKIDAVPDPPSLTDLRRRCEAMLPRVDIGEVVLEVMSWQPEFAAAFTLASGGQARLDDLGVSVAAALTAHALNVGFTPVITPGMAALTRHRISHVDQNYLRAETYAAANAPLITAQADIGLAKAWAVGCSPRWTGSGSSSRCAPSTPAPTRATSAAAAG